jgi:xanthine dehydrogenase accessory factor
LRSLRIDAGRLFTKNEPVMVTMTHVLSSAPSQSDWPLYGLVDDVRPAIQEMFDASQTGALVTLVGADGPTPRPIGSQMLVTSDHRAAGYVSGGCVEASLEVICQEVMADRKVRHLRFGANSPFLDVQLVCGTSIDLVVEPVSSSDLSWAAVLEAMAARKPIVRTLTIDALAVLSAPSSDQNDANFGATPPAYRRTYLPKRRIVVTGSDPVALALLALGQASGFEMHCVRPLGSVPPPVSIDAFHNQALEEDAFDPWTACVTTTHDLDQDHDILVTALASTACYVGALGSIRKRPQRLSRLQEVGLSPSQIERLRSPVGLDIGAATPYEIAISILADIIAHMRT